MTNCPDLYIGNSRAEAPSSPVWQNPAIAAPVTSMTSGLSYDIPVTVRNAGLATSPSSRLELHYADPSTGFVPIGQIHINNTDPAAGSDAGNPGNAVITIAGHEELSGTDGATEVTYRWTPPLAVTLPNGGHVCLLARVRMLSAPPDEPHEPCAQEIYTATPQTDKLQGIRNIHVYDPSSAGESAGGAGGGGAGEFMQFAFAATNTLPHIDETLLEVRLLDPKKHRKELVQLVADPMVDRALRQRRLKFGVPDALRIAEGRERILNRHSYKGIVNPCAHKRLSRTGPVSEAELKHLLSPGKKLEDVAKPLAFPLKPGETQQTILQVKPCKGDDKVYAVQVGHATKDGKPIGGLTILFVPPHNYF